MPTPISTLTGGALALTGAVLAIAAVTVVLLLSPSSSSAAAPTPISRQGTSVGTILGARQVTYAGHPLYRCSADDRRGDISYVGANQFGGDWPAVNAAGRLVH